ncbi:hypothetical protein HQQ88_19005 [Curtobacterium sp. VKM Ac-2861]|uniref:hypothetical protein n=1 Tax=Curtobacterium sp. VKM Ac-2861 TaxID=2739016 RepID=UPI001566ACA3|nr:hypothetical protein [Curtobacterium sp. VKM Ac-2861]
MTFDIYPLPDTVRKVPSPHAVAVWDATRTDGHISAAKARLLAPELDRENATAYRVNSEPPVGKIALYVCIPHIHGIRALHTKPSEGRHRMVLRFPLRCVGCETAFTARVGVAPTDLTRFYPPRGTRRRSRAT